MTSDLSRFRVRISGMGVRNMMPSWKSAPNPYLKLNFDYFKHASVDYRHSERDAAWGDAVIEFDYTTKHASRLAKKKLVVEAWHHRKWLSDTPIGALNIDLHTIATGPAEHRGLPLKDAGHVTGLLDIKVEFEQVCDVSINLRDVEVVGAEPSMRDPTKGYLQYSYTGYKDVEASMRTAQRGRLRVPYPDVLWVTASLRELLESGVLFRLREDVRFASDPVVGEAVLPLLDHYSFEDGRAMSFRATMDRISAYVTGTIFFKNFPQFMQMSGGYHSDTGIHHATFPVETIPNKPTCPVNRPRPPSTIAAAERSARRRGDRPSAIAVPPPPPAPRPAGAGGAGPYASYPSNATGARGGDGLGGVPVLPPPTIGPMAAMLATGAANFGHYSTIDRGVGPGYPVPPASPAAAYSPRPPAAGIAAAGTGAGTGASGVGTWPGAAASAALRAPWERCTTDTGRVYFKNHAWHYTVWHLPTDPEYRVTFTKPGSLGLAVTVDNTSALRVGAKRAAGAVVNNVVPGSPAEQAGLIKPGHLLIRINGTPCQDWPLTTLVEVLSRAERPVTLRFFNPDAVAVSEAEAAMR